jgi:hypothetical protein
MPLSARVCLLPLLLVTMASCSKPEPPPSERRPEPQAQRTELRDAIQQPIDKAKAAEKSVQDAADQQKAAIEAAGG